jgi:hypothetical protein
MGRQGRQVGEKVGIGERKLPGGDVCEEVGRAGQVVLPDDITVGTLVEGGIAKEVTGRTRRGGGRTPAPSNRGCVVREDRKRLLADIMGGREDGGVCDGTGQFQVGVGEGTGRVILRNQGRLERGGKGGPPDVGGVVGGVGGGNARG